MNTRRAPRVTAPVDSLSGLLAKSCVVSDATDAKGAKLVESSARGLARLIEEMHATCADEWTGTAPLYPPQGTDEEF